MKKLLVAALLVSATLSLAGCGKSNEKENVTIKEMVTTEDAYLQSGQSVSSVSNSMTIKFEKLKVSKEKIKVFADLVNNKEFKPGDKLSVEALDLKDEETITEFDRLFRITFGYFEFDAKEKVITFNGHNTPSVEIDNENGKVTFSKDAYIKE